MTDIIGRIGRERSGNVDLSSPVAIRIQPMQPVKIRIQPVTIRRALLMPLSCINPYKPICTPEGHIGI